MKKGFKAVFIYGEQGGGKSIYSMKVARDILYRIGYGKVSWREIIDRFMFFVVDDFYKKIEKVRWKNRYPLLIWDDAGVYGSSYLFYTDKKAAKEITDVFKTIRTRVGVLFMSSPGVHDILRPIRHSEIVIVHVDEVSEWRAEAHSYVIKVAPSGKRTISKISVDRFWKRLPDKDYEYYNNLRDKYVDLTLQGIRLRKMEETVYAASKLYRNYVMLKKRGLLTLTLERYFKELMKHYGLNVEAIEEAVSNEKEGEDIEVIIE